MTDVRVPTLGESVTEATVATWFKQPGDSINIDEMLCELETDKVTVEVPSPVAGIMGEIIAQEGTVVSMDALLTTIGEGTTKKSNDEAKASIDTSEDAEPSGTCGLARPPPPARCCASPGRSSRGVSSRHRQRGRHTECIRHTFLTPCRVYKTRLTPYRAYQSLF